jgi:hypothetical protein
MPTVIPGIGTIVLASDLITRAAKALGYIGRTETLSASEANDGLDCLNALLDSWPGESLMGWAVNQQQFTMTIGQQAYTIGTIGTPDINNTRPTDISSAFVRDTNNLDYGMNILNNDQWDSIGLKSNASRIPTALYYDPQIPLGVIYIFPVPSQAFTVFYSQMLQQNTFALLTTQLSAPPGYARGIVMNLALEMMSAGFPCLLNADGLAQLRYNAAEAKANVKRTNIKDIYSECDAAVIATPNSSYNVYSDGFTR